MNPPTGIVYRHSVPVQSEAALVGTLLDAVARARADAGPALTDALLAAAALENALADLDDDRVETAAAPSASA